jgi:hypothetical protein
LIASDNGLACGNAKLNIAITKQDFSSVLESGTSGNCGKLAL